MLVLPWTKAGEVGEAGNLAAKAGEGIEAVNDMEKLSAGARLMKTLSRLTGFGDTLLDSTKLQEFMQGYREFMTGLKAGAVAKAEEAGQAIGKAGEALRGMEVSAPATELATEAGSIGGKASEVLKAGETLEKASQVSRVSEEAREVGKLASEVDEVGELGKAGEPVFEPEPVELPSGETAYKSSDLANGEPVLVRSPEYLNDAGHIKWPEADGFVTDSKGEAITQEAQLKAGQVIDRYGSSSGTFTSPLENGEKLAYNSRGLPYPEGYQPYHKYEVVKDITKKNVLDGFNKLSDKNKQLLLNDMEDYRFTFDDIAKPKSGKIAKIFGQGGGTQIKLGTTVSWYEKLGLLREV